MNKSKNIFNNSSFSPSNNIPVCVYGPPSWFSGVDDPLPTLSEDYKKQPRIVIVGMGALGLLYGSIVELVGRAKVSFLMDEERLQKNSSKTFSVNGRPFHFKLVTPATVEPADLVIVATKYPQLDSAIELLKSCEQKEGAEAADTTDTGTGFPDEAPCGVCLTPNSTIVSVLNGITSERVLAEAFGAERVIGCVAQGMDAVKLSDELNYSLQGILFIGKLEGSSDEALDRAVRAFSEGRISYSTDDNIMLRMWKKFMLNCGINQSCMVYGTTYGDACNATSETHRTFLASMREVMQLARLEGYEITEKDIEFFIDLLKELDQTRMPSMAQDRIARRRSEVETFAGTVIKLAEKHGLEVPVNRWIYDEVKKIEAEY